MTWLTMTDVVCIDVAVAQATQTLQQLQQQQAALYSGMGAKYMPQYYPYHPDQDSKRWKELPGSTTLQICSLGL